jgi:poly(hydroxyalkanoate) depolymerase family esterase
MKRMARALAGVAGAVLALGAVGAATSPPAHAAPLQQVTSFGANPSNLGMYVYVPDNVPADAPIVVAIHYCTGSAQAMYSGTQFDELANQYGYIVIYPSATRSGTCFDVSSPQALKRGGGSDPVGIASMVSYVQSHYDTDPERVFVTGTSSGAMMTQVMLANYPDVFAAGSAFAGVPASCFATTDGSSWNSQCAQGRIDRTPTQWGDLVRAAYPGYTGERPRVQLWHGTNDETLDYANFREAVEQWTNVHGLTTTPAATDTPQSGQTRTRYGSAGPQAPVEAISLSGVSHNLPVNALEALRFFGLTTPAPDPDPGPDPGPDPDPDPGPDPVDMCAVSYSANSWNTGFTGSVTVTNIGPAPISGWTLTWSFSGGQQVTQAWGSTVTQSGSTVTQSGSTVTAVNAPWNGSIAPDASVQFGFNGTHSGTNPAPTGFTLNGAPCR